MENALHDMGDDEWKQRLTPDQYRVLRQKVTESPFSGTLVDNHADGAYVCAGCGTMLFDSGAKFDSGSGWPSFTDPINLAHVKLEVDMSQGMRRTEVLCAHCGGHLGHVFDDGPSERGGMRYCVNSCSLEFKPRSL